MIHQKNNFEIYPAGFVQRREWMLYKIRDDHSPFNISLSFASNAFEPHHFQKVIDLMVQKHEILRTTLKVMGGLLHQIVHNPENFPISYTYYNLIGETPEKQELFLKKKKTVQSVASFNFEYGPMFRIMVVSLSEQYHEVNLFFHHVIFDTQSIEIFKKDVLAIWNNLNDSLSEGMNQVQSQYRAYATFENKLLDTDLGDEHREYWNNELKKGFLRLQIIEDSKWDFYIKNRIKRIAEVKSKLSSLSYWDERLIGSVVRRYKAEKAGSANYFYDNQTFKNVVAYKEETNVSFLSLFIGSLLLALYELSGQEVFVFDIPATRKKDGFYKNVIGWLTAGGLCYFDITKRKKASDLLDHIDEQLYLLSRHCFYPVETLGFKNNLPVASTIPIFFTLIENAQNLDELENVDIVSHEFEDETCFENLNIFVSVFDNACSICIRYDNFLFSSQLIENIIISQKKQLTQIAQVVSSNSISRK